MAENYELIHQGLRVTATAPLSLEAWEKMGVALARGLDNWHWAIGDWLLYGEEVLSESIWPDKNQAGQSKYDKAARITGLDLEMLERCATVARAYLQGDRIPGATWSRHREALAWPVSQRFNVLRRSVDQRWSTKRWQEQLSQARAGKKDVRGKRDRHAGQIRCPHCGEWFHHKRGEK